MAVQAPEELSTTELAGELAEQLDADVIHYNGPLQRNAAMHLTEQCNMRRKRKNAVLILMTLGGDPDSAYRIARCLQNNYERFLLYAHSYCKSAGTLIATGAHELIMSDHGELGPIDVQMSKKDELWEFESGLTVTDTLTSLQEKALSTFEDFFLTIKSNGGGSITLRTATDIATAITTGLFAPLYKQVDPLHLGEAGRAMRIADQYGERLLSAGGNIGTEGLNILLTAYPSHDFVIDRGEASTLFKNVREPTGTEVQLASALGLRALVPDIRIQSQPQFQFLSPELPDTANQSEQIHTKGNSHEQSRETTRNGLEGATQNAHSQPSANGSDEEKDNTESAFSGDDQADIYDSP